MTETLATARWFFRAYSIESNGSFGNLIAKGDFKGNKPAHDACNDLIDQGCGYVVMECPSQNMRLTRRAGQCWQASFINPPDSERAGRRA